MTDGDVTPQVSARGVPVRQVMNHFFNFIDGVANGNSVYVKPVIFCIVGIIGLVFFWWSYRVIRIVRAFFRNTIDVIGGEYVEQRKFRIFFKKEEIRGVYQGRQVLFGVDYSGFNGEFLPLPFIQMKLKEVISYNYHRLPNYATIEKNNLIFKVKVSLLFGVFDKNYPKVFSRNYFVIALEKMIATAEDVERGRAISDIFK